MITYSSKSIFDSEAQTLVNPVNCVGVMGAGLAKEFKVRYPAMFESYSKACKVGLLTPGMLQLHKTNSKWILNFPTKTDWRVGSTLGWIEAGLGKFASSYKEVGITSVAFPEIGCGLGGLDWDDVRALMCKYLDNLDIPVEICRV